MTVDATRDYAVMITLPDNIEDNNSYRQRLILAIRDLFNSNAGIDRVEFLSWPKKYTQAYVLCVSSTKMWEDLSPTQQRSLHQSSTIEHEDLDRVQTVLLEKVKKRMPAAADVKIGWLDLSPLGSSYVTTSRFAIPGDEEIPHWDPASAYPFEDILQTLNDEPYLYQVILTQAPRSQRGDYKVTIRVALFALRHQYRTSEEMTKRTRKGVPLDPADIVRPTLPLRSNLRFLRYISKTGTFSIITRGKNSTSESKIRALARTEVEYRNLLLQKQSGKSAYSSEGYYERIIFREKSLHYLLGPKPVTRDKDPFEDLTQRDSPIFRSIAGNSDQSRPAESETMSIASNTDEDSDIAPENRYENVAGNVPNEGGDDHQEAIKVIVRIFREYGWSVYIVPQDTKSRPDLWVQTDTGEIFAVEIESKNKSKPAKLLNNLARAKEQGYQVIIVTVGGGEDAGEEAKQTAKLSASRIAKPFKAIHDYRTLLYNRSSAVTVEGGATLLLPKNAEEAKWYLLPDATIELEVDGKQIASGPVDEPLGNFEYPLDRVQRDDKGRLEVVGPDGDTKHVYANEKDFKRTKLQRPHAPRDLSYFDIVESIRTLEDSQLKEYQPSARWDSREKSTRYEGGVSDFFDTFVVERDGERLMESECRPFGIDWIDFFSAYSPPGKIKFGTYRDDDRYPRSRNNRDDRGYFYKNYTWRFPRGIDSPALPDPAPPGFPDDWTAD